MTDGQKHAEPKDNSDIKRSNGQIVGTQAYSMVGTRANITCAISVVSKRVDSPTDDDSVRVK